jgi:hypothetical protein
VSSAGLAKQLNAMRRCDNPSVIPADFRRMINRWIRNRANHLLRHALVHQQLDDFDMPTIRRDAGWEYF